LTWIIDAVVAPREAFGCAEIQADWRLFMGEAVKHPPPPSAKIIRQIDKAEMRLKQLEMEEADRFADGLIALRDHYRKELVALAPKDKLATYHALHKRRIRIMRLARGDLEGDFIGRQKRLDEMRRRMVAESTRLVEESGVEVTKVRELQKDCAAKAQELFFDTIGKGEVARPRAHAENLDYRAPFLGSGLGHVAAMSSGSRPPYLHPTYETWLDRITGDIGASAHVQILEADDFDLSYFSTRLYMRIVYTPDRSCEGLSVRIELEAPGATWCDGRIENECGISSVSVSQSMRVFVQRTWPTASGRIYGELPGGSAYTDTDDSTHSWAWTIVPGTLSSPVRRTVYLSVPGRLARDEMCGLNVGLEVRNECLSNDCTVSSRLYHRYAMREIGVTGTQV